MKKIILQNHFNPYANKDHHANINAKPTLSNVNLNHESNLQYSRPHNNGFKNINNIKTNNFFGISTTSYFQRGDFCSERRDNIRS